MLKLSNFIKNNYEIIEKLGEGSFGEIYKGKNLLTGKYYAIKIEKGGNNLIIKNEAKIYLLLKHLTCIPKLVRFEKDSEYNYLIIDLLDKSLKDFLNKKFKLNLNLILSIGIQMIKIIKDVHDENIIHRDIKPHNFMFDLNEKNKIKLIDFGLSKSYYKNKKHIPYKKIKSIIGTLNYVSINIHKGFTPSRRDDLESIGYILIYMILGKLPWQNLNLYGETKKEKNLKIMKLKLEIDSRYNNKIPQQIIRFIKYCRTLSFFTKPDYNYLYNLLKKI